MRLAACVPPIPEDLLSSLAQVGIQTDSDLLFSGSTSDIFQRLPRGTTTLKELAQITALVAESASAQGHKASDLLRDSEPDRFLSGVPQLDQFLEGLTTPRRMIEVSGDRGSGKTSLLLYLVLRHLVEQPQSSVLWIDTTGDFSVIRAEEILQNFDGPGASTTLDRLQVSLALEVDAVYEVLEDLRLSFNMSRVQGIVVDCVTPLFSSLLSPVSSHGHAIMTLFMRQLRAFATTFSITVFVVNNSTLFTPFVPGSASNNPNIRKPSLGPSFTFLTDATVWLVLDAESDSGNEGTKHIAQLYRSKITAPKSPCWFEMRQDKQVETNVDMSDSPLHQVHFSWPSTSPNSVIVTGTFDQWSSSLHLVKDESGFWGSTYVPFDTKILYKYVVDSEWFFSPSLPTETDAAGNTNNVYTSPPKPEPVNGGPVNGIVIEASAEPTVTAAPLAPDVPIAIVPVNSEETNPSPAAETSAETELPSTHTPVTAPPAETTVPLAETTPVSEPVSAPVPETTTKTEQPTSTSVTPRTETQHTFPSANGADSAASVASSTTSSPSKYGTVGSRKNRKSIFRRITGIFGSDKEGRK